MIAESQVSAGPAMMFATLDYEGCCVKNKTEEIATQWAAMLRTSGMDVSTCAFALAALSPGRTSGAAHACCCLHSSLRAGVRWDCRYVIEDDQVLFSTQTGTHAGEIRDYVTKQKECVAVEWNQKRTPGPAESEEWKAKDAVKKAKREEERKQKEAEDAAIKAREEKLKKKKKKKKKAAKEEL
jgi:hypothetical protein